MPVKKGIRFEIFVFRLDFHKCQLSTVNCQLESLEVNVLWQKINEITTRCWAWIRAPAPMI